MRKMRKEVWIACVVFLLDRLAKIAAREIPEGGMTLIPGVLGLRYTRNTGMAFSLLSGRPWLLGLLSLAVIVAAFLYLRNKDIPRLPMIGLMLMLGGAAGNMFDRFFTGYVTDMIELLFVYFAIFNPADIALTIGCAIVVISLLRGDGSGSSAKTGEDWQESENIQADKT